MLGSFKFAAGQAPGELLGRSVREPRVHEPYSPSWSLDGWTVISVQSKMSPISRRISSTARCATRRRSLRHHRRAIESQRSSKPRRGAAPGAARSASAGAFEQRFSLGGNQERFRHAPAKYGNANDRDQFHVLWATFRSIGRPGSAVATLRGDVDWVNKAGGRFAAGPGSTTT